MFNVMGVGVMMFNMQGSFERLQILLVSLCSPVASTVAVCVGSATWAMYLYTCSLSYLAFVVVPVPLGRLS